MGLFTSLFGKKENTKETKEKQDKNFQILKYDGMRADSIGQTNYAIKCFVEALKIEDDFETKTYLANIYIRIGELEKAKTLLEELIRKEPNYVNTYISLAKLLYMMKEYKEMAKIAEEAINIEEGNEMAHFLLAKAKADEPQDEYGIRHVERSLEINSEFLDARILRIEALLKLNKLDDAQEDIEALLAAAPESEDALLLKTKWAEIKGDEKIAIDTYRTIIEINPFSERAYLGYANILLEQKNYQMAEQVLADAIEMDDNSVALYKAIANVYQQIGDVEKANKNILRAEEIEKASLEGDDDGKVLDNMANQNVLHI